MLDISVRYPLQVDTSDPAGYPRGKARNVGVIGDGTGTPLEKDLVNDILGLQQALLAKASLTPSGIPDKVGASQQLDAIEFIAETSHAEFNIKKFGAIINGATDDTTAFQACVTALAAAGGGKVVVPYGVTGVIRLTNKIVMPRGVSIYFVPGVQVLFDHDTNGVFSWEATSATGQGQDTIENLWLEGAQANTGTIFSFATYAEVIFKNCRCNIVNGLMRGSILNQAGSSITTFRDCLLISQKTAAASFVVVGEVSFSGGEAAMAPAATANLITGSGKIILDRVKLTHASTVGGVAFVGMQSGCEVRMSGCRGERSGTGKTYLLELSSAGRAVTRGNNLLDGGFQSYDFYLVTTRPVQLGSDLQLVPSREHADSASVTFTCMDGVRQELFLCTDINAPTFTLPKILAQGQRFTLLIWNHHGSGNWAGAPVIAAQSPDVVLGNGLAGLANAGALTMEFAATYVDYLGVYHWLQVGAPVKI